mmetsp:Transcript_31252/g.57168  ORF Transcript_31252/g.57168 Transcript_31252/m.57168 type:complete len:359 (-) Transcript_31252:102-1178(-)
MMQVNTVLPHTLLGSAHHQVRHAKQQAPVTPVAAHACKSTAAHAAWQCMPATAVAAGAACLAGFQKRNSKRRAKGAIISRSAGGAGRIETFLVEGDVNEAKLAAACAPLAMHMDLDGLVFFTLGVKPETIASVAGGALGLHGVCPVYIADSYGIVGWDKSKKENVELMEEGRGSEYGKVGGNGGKGVVVTAFRGGHVPSEGDLPSDKGLHMFITEEGKPGLAPQGAVYGGVAKKCYKLEHSGDLVPVPQFAVSTPQGVVTSFTGDAGEAAKGALASSGSLEVAGYFPCFCRGVNEYGKDNVEPAAFASNGMESVPLFGMFAHGEIGPPKGSPVLCDTEQKAVEVEMHSMTSVLAGYPA